MNFLKGATKNSPRRRRSCAHPFVKLMGVKHKKKEDGMDHLGTGKIDHSDEKNPHNTNKNENKIYPKCKVQK